MLGCWLMSYMTDEMLKRISGFDSSREAWTKLEKSFTSKSRARVIQVKEELHGVKKGNQSIINYVLKIKFLQSAGYGVSIEEKLMSVLSRLDESYENVFSTFTERMMTEEVTIADAIAFLHNHECRLEIRRSTMVSPLLSKNLSVTNLDTMLNVHKVLDNKPSQAPNTIMINQTQASS